VTLPLIVLLLLAGLLTVLPALRSAPAPEVEVEAVPATGAELPHDFMDGGILPSAPVTGDVNG
jgi:hypothetical protein